MKKQLFFFSIAFILACIGDVNAQITPQLLGRYSTGLYDKASAEINAYHSKSKQLFVTNGPDTSLKVVSLANPTTPVQVATISIKPYGSDLTSVAVSGDLVAVAVVDSTGKTGNGNIVFFNANTLAFISKVKVGALPDMVTFTPNGLKVLVANEGEPNEGYTIDREGSISIIDIAGGAAGITQANVQTAGFTSFNGTNIDPKIKITGRIQTDSGTFLRNSTIAEDLEPEYITISDDNATAWVTCQENNCIAEVNIATATVTRLIALGFKNYSLPENKLDASDQGGAINFANYPVFGMYQSDAINSFKIGSTTYLVTANEGDARADWGAANNEEVRFGNASYVVDTAKFGGASAVAALKANTALGRLNVTNRFGDFNNDGKFDSIFAYGARSFSVWNGTTGALVWDSKDEFEQRTAALFPANFNASSTNNTFKNRSDDKGPEPEALTVGKILDSTYAFIGLERIGGIMVYNVTNPNAPYYVSYINTRNYGVTPSLANIATVGDLAPEGLTFVPASQSPNGKNLLLVSNETSGTIAIIQLNTRNTGSAYQMQILHSGDMESGLSAVVDAPNYAAIMDKLEDQHVNTLILSSGDNTLPGPFLSSGEDPSLQTPLRNTAARYYSGTQALRAAIGRADIAIMNIIGFNASALGNHEFDLGTTDLNGQIGVDIRSNGADKRWLGAQFPYVSCNLNFSNDVNLSYLYTNQILRDTAFKTSPTITNNNQKRGLAPSVIIERNGEKIGIVGATTQVLAKISSPGFTSIIGPQVDDMPALAAIIQPVVDSLIAKEGVNKIILLAHLQQIANEKALAPLLRNVDIIISGGNHAISADGNDRLIAGNVRTEQYPIRTTSLTSQPMVILNNSSEWKYVGRFVCDFDSAGVLLPNLLDSTINGVYASDSLTVTSLWGNYNAAFAAGTKGADVRIICNAVNNVILAKDGNIIGKSRVFLEGRRNFVRTEETNLGNLSSDANLWYAKQYDPQVRVSLKNGGGIRSAVGTVNAVGGNVTLESTQANPTANKAAGDISQLDVENSLRFNNGLVIVTTNAAGLRRLLEHGIAASTPNATPGQFPQVGGVAFSYDTTRSANNRIVSMVIIDSLGNKQDTIVRNGVLFGDTSRMYKTVTLNFLANPSSVGSPVGGDNYPFPQVVTARVNLDTAIKSTGTATFAGIGSEQDAFAEYMLARHNTLGTAFSLRDTTLQGDKRIQLLNARVDSIIFQYPTLTLAQARAATPSSVVKTRGIVTRAWGRFIYIQDATGAIGVRQSSGAMVDSIITNGIRQGDSIEVIGVRADFNNYAQITVSTGAYTTTSSITRLATGRPLPAAQVLTVKQFLASPESFESELVRIVNLRTSASGAFASSTNYNVWDGSSVGDTTVLRVIASQDSEVDDAPAINIPSFFTFEGTVIQFCSSPTSGCNIGYQLQGIRKTDIIPQLAPFNLISPANNARIEVAKNSPDAILINWSASNNTAKYRWKATIPAGNFNIPLLNLPSDINGTDTKLTLTSGAIDAILKSNGLKVGDSITLKWTVYALETNDSLQAAQTFNITLARKRILGNFNLTAPANNVTVAIDSNNSTPINISWSASTNATKYKWLAIAAGGNFNNPLLSLTSDNNGTTNTLSLTSGAVDAVLASNGVKDGDSLSLSWTVRAIEQEDSILANQTFIVKFVRTKNVGLGKYDISNKVNIYPNPTSELINITTTNLTGEGQITLTDLTGRLVLTSNINLDKNQTSVDVSKLNQGIYFLKVVTQQGNATFKVNIQ
jgi:2',3'-cyclic-nucleotide 2'-phosphodiesterase (5'-nucleotidase family)